MQESTRAKGGIQLPPEIIESILIACSDSPRTLTAACLTSRMVRHEAERLLYRSVVLTSTINTIYFLSALSSSPKRPGYIHSMNLRDKSTSRYSNDDQINHHDYLGYWEVEWSSFPAAKFLRHLSSTLVNLSTFHIDAPVSLYLPENAPFHLRSFRCRFSNKCLRLSPFLNTQPSITDLELTHRREHLELQPTALPHLMKLAGTPELLVLLIPGRPVANVVVAEFPDRSATRLRARSSLLGLIGTLSRNTIPVQSLEWKGAGSDLELINTLAMAAPHLQYLKLEDVIYDAEPGHISFPTTSWASAFAKFNDLKELSIYIHFKRLVSVTSHYLSALCELEAFREEFLTALASSSKSLRKVKWMKHPLYWRENEKLPWRQDVVSNIL